MARADLSASSKKTDTLPLLTHRFWLGIFAACFVLFFAVDIHYHSYTWLQEIKKEVSEMDFKSAKFCEANARNMTERICAFGVRTVGTDANEIEAKDLILHALNDIQKIAKPVHEISVDLQKPKGCFELTFIGHFTSCYEDVKNILVKLSPAKSKSDSTLLVNCHFDTAISSPGASDDVVSCATMLEVLRVFALRDVPLKHSIVFNFNGAEETILQASHGFITQHDWTKDLKAFVNLEAAGSGGREMLFQTGPEHPWLIDAYARSTPYPFASVIAQEIFQSGIIPSDTDFRIYRDHGHIPGIDIAYNYNGYIYHTKHDRPEYIPKGCIQRGGENLLALLTHLANSDKLSEPGDSRLGKMVFFDLLGFTMVYYPLKLGLVINCIIIVLVLIDLSIKLKSFKREGLDSSLYVKLLFVCWGMHLVGFFLMIATAVALGFIMTSLKAMSWYTNNWLVAPLYILPAVAVWLFTHQHGKQLLSPIYQRVSIWKLESIFFEAAILFWTILLALMTLAGLGSSYMCMLLIVFPLAGRQIIRHLLNYNMFDNQRMYICLTLLFLLPPCVHILQLVHLLFVFFLPLMGRVGSEDLPDVTVAVISLVPVIVFSIFLTGFLIVSQDQTKLAIRFILLNIIFIVLVNVTELGFPYGGNIKSPTPQRHVLHHYQSEFYDLYGSLESSHHGLIYMNFDYNGHRYIKEHVPIMKEIEFQHSNPDLAYGGWPYYFPLIKRLRKIYTAEMAPPNVQETFDMKYKTVYVDEHTRLYNFTVSGEVVVLNIYMSTRQNSILTAWSFTDNKPFPSDVPASYNRDHYFIYTTSADRPQPDRQFTITVKSETGFEPNVAYLDFALASHDLQYQGPELLKIMNQFPNWTAPIGWTVLHKHYRL